MTDDDDGYGICGPLPPPSEWRDMPLWDRDRVECACWEARSALCGRRKKGEPPRTVEAVAKWIGSWADRDWERADGTFFPREWLEEVVVLFLGTDRRSQEHLARRQGGAR